MTTPSPDPSSAYIDVGVIGFVFGEMWRRGVLSARDRRFITLACLGSTDTSIPIEPTLGGPPSGDITAEEFDEFVLHFARSWAGQGVRPEHDRHDGDGEAGGAAGGAAPAARVRAVDRSRSGRGTPCSRRRFVPAVHGQAPPLSSTPFGRQAYLDYLYGEIWTREEHLTRRDRRIISICCCAAVGVEAEIRAHLEAALRMRS